MLSIKQLKGKSESDARSCSEYPDKEKKGHKDDYYAKELCDQNWGGSIEAMKALGIDPEAKECDLEQRINLMMGKHADGSKTHCQGPKGADKERRFGYDFTFSAPKSVSTVWAATKNEELKLAIQNAHRKAVTVAMEEASSFVKIRTGAGGMGEPVAAECVYSSFHHGTSRELDPQLHSHNVMYNLAMRADGKFRTIEAKDIYANQHYIGAVYRAELAQQLKELGLSIEQDGTSFKIPDVNEALIDQWSKRSNQIKTEAAKRGAFSAATKEKITVAGRTGKKEGVSSDEEQVRWKQEAEALGYVDPVTREPISQDYSRGVLLELLTSQTSTFSEQDLRKELAQYAQYCAKGRDFIKAEFDIIMQSPELVNLREADPASNTKALYSTRDMLMVESNMLDNAITLRNSAVGRTDFSRQLATYQREKGFNLSDEQVAAVEEMTREGQLSVIRGVAGAGKTTSAEVAYHAFKAEGRNVIGLAIAAKAARGMKDASDDQSTLCRFVMDVSNGKRQIKPNDVFILDEAGMVGSRMMNTLLDIAEKNKAKVVLIGDEKQVQAIDAGGSFDALMRYAAPDFAEIKAIMRQKDAGNTVEESKMHLAAVTALENSQVSEALSIFKDLNCINIQKEPDSAAQAASDAYFKFRQLSDETQVIVTAANHADVNLINDKIREQIGIKGEGIEVKTADGLREFAMGDRIIFRKNKQKKGEAKLTNGDLGSIVGVEPKPEGGAILKILRDVDQKTGVVITIDTDEYKDLRHGYAMTVHASQGVTVERAVGVANAMSSLASSEIMYVQASRHKKDFALIGYADTDPERVHARLTPEESQLDATSAEYLAAYDNAEKTEIEQLLSDRYSRSSKKNTTLDFVCTINDVQARHEQVREMNGKALTPVEWSKPVMTGIDAERE